MRADLKAEARTLLSNYSFGYEIENKYKKIMLNFLAQDDAPFSKHNKKGHFTASAWLLSADLSYVLLTKHAKLRKWVQLGGHIEESDVSFLSACLREVEEESGIRLARYSVDNSFVIDIDIHSIPQTKEMPEHLHYDITMCFVVDVDKEYNNIIRSEESLQLSWILLDDIFALSSDAALLRMATKTKTLIISKQG